MLVAIVVFLVATAVTVAIALSAASIPDALKEQRLEQRLRDVGSVSPEVEAALIREEEAGALPGVHKLIGSTGAGPGLKKLIEQSGVKMSVSTFVLLTVGLGAIGVAALAFLAPVLTVAPIGLLLGALPLMFLLQRRSARIRRFEEQFPEALDLLSRALRAGHAFQTAMGMVADEMVEPVGPEFKKTFDQQNFGLPLKECLVELADRIPLLDVRFFVTAVTIQRETGGNLAEILDNLAHVVRERFKVLRQVRVHTAHGRFTGYVLLALPAVLGIALSMLSPDHMNTLFTEPMGQTMLMGAAVMQAVGYIWIRQIIKIEV
jgi:tight adherence protein B